MSRNLLFLNHASEAPVSYPVRSRIDAYMNTAMLDPDAANPRIDEVKGQLSSLMGGSPDEYALVPNTATGIALVANGLNWKPGDNVVVPAEEYPANVYPWLALKAHGVEVRTVPLHGYRVQPEAVEALVDDRTRVVAISAVAYVSGFRADLKAISQIAHARGALFVVDGIQACGAVPIHVEQDGIDVLVAGGYKWLMGPIGTGFAYLRKAVWKQIRPTLPGARSSRLGSDDYGAQFELLETAQRYETGCMPFSLIAGWSAGLQMLLDGGVENIHRHLLALTDYVAEGLRQRGYTILSPMDDPAERSGIVVFTSGDTARDEAMVRRLYHDGIVIAFRGGRCRVSPSFYNTKGDLDLLLEAL